MSRRSGILILDTNCYGRLSDPAARSRFEANIRTADWIPAPSQVNVAEAIASPTHIQRRLLPVINSILGKRALLIWPYELLRRVGQSLHDGNDTVWLDERGHEHYLADPAAAEALRPKAAAQMRAMKERFLRLHRGARVSLNRKMKAQGLNALWPDVGTFLEEYWRPSDMRQHFARAIWGSLRLPGDAPADLLVDAPAWSLMLDAHGVAVYWAVARKQPKLVHQADLIQLPYLAGRERRMIATTDGPFLDAATAVLANHPNARAVHFSDLLT